MNETTSTIAPQEERISGPGKAYSAKAYAAQNAGSGLAPTSIQRRAPRPQDVEIEIRYCGVCHSDLHQVRDEWHAVMPTVYPCVPGHEIVGRVTRIGSAVKKFKEGDFAAVGCMVGHCAGPCRRFRQVFLGRASTLPRIVAVDLLANLRVSPTPPVAELSSVACVVQINPASHEVRGIPTFP